MLAAEMSVRLSSQLLVLFKGGLQGWPRTSPCPMKELWDATVWMTNSDSLIPQIARQDLSGHQNRYQPRSAILQDTVALFGRMWIQDILLPIATWGLENPLPQWGGPEDKENTSQRLTAYPERMSHCFLTRWQMSIGCWMTPPKLILRKWQHRK